MNLQQFLQSCEGRGIDYDGSYGYQCMDLAEYYNKEVVGAPPLGGNAIAVWNSFPAGHYHQIANELANFPAPGDVVVWGQDSRAGTGPYGHIAICISADVNSFVSLDQNWPTGSVCHRIAHNYYGVLGWGHPTTSTSPSQPPSGGNPPKTAAQAVSVLARHAADLQAHPSVTDTNKLISDVCTKWPKFTT